MATQISHSGGLLDAVIELGFDQVKYFESTITTIATGFSINPPARKIILNNRSKTETVYLRVNGSPAGISVSFTPGNNIKIGPGCNFTMDFDSLKEISLITVNTNAKIEGILGWKGTI